MAGGGTLGLVTKDLRTSGFIPETTVFKICKELKNKNLVLSLSRSRSLASYLYRALTSSTKVSSNTFFAPPN